MPITVVIARDSEGATTTREVYAAGSRYSIGNSNLQIFSAQSTLLALYGSGNWLSVHVDTPAAAGADPVSGARAAAAAAAAERTARLEAPLTADGAGGVMSGGSPQEAPGESAPAAARVVAEPEPATGWVERPLQAATERPPGMPASMRAIVFRPKTFPAARAPETPAPASDAAPRMQSVAFRPRMYRAAREALERQAREDAERARRESGGGSGGDAADDGAGGGAEK